ncbi:MAG: M48 family metallopeptidase [Gemmatimonadetes bacterium]|nr:M48 family metallopeptidase [Gemmatimonadota bacterium]
MDHNYDALATRLTEYARLHPRLYRARVAGLAVLGYAYLFGAIIVLAALVAGAVWMILNNVGAWAAIKLGFPVAVLTWMVGKSLWVRFVPPEGLEITRGEAPELFAEIERVRTAMRAPRVHKVLVTDDFNAGVNQYPRLGILGWYRVYLTLGLPLMGGMPLDEFRAVLAHEFGHVSRAHGRFGAWIARVRWTWMRLMRELEQKNHWAQSLFSRFFSWYAPYFEAYTAVLSRSEEYEADRMAQGVSGGAAGPSFCRMEITARYLQRAFWPEVFGGTLAELRPPSHVHVRLLDAVRGAHEHASAAEWLAEGLRQPTRATDSHPATLERLNALGLKPAMPHAFEQSAAEALLGARVEPLAHRLTHAWRQQVEGYWLDQHRRSRELAARLDALAEKEAAGTLTREEAGERVWLTAQLHGDRVAVPMARALLDAEHEDATIHYLLGRALADENDLAALPHLERALTLDHEFTPPACAAAADLMARLGREDDSREYVRRIEAYHQRLACAQRERSPQALSPRDRFLPHGLDEEQLAAVREAVAVRGVKAAYLVRREVHHFPELPCFVVALAPGTRVGLPGETQRLVDRVADEVSLPGTCIVLVLEATQRRFAKPLRAVAGSEVYRRPSVWRRGDRTPAA